MEADLRTQPDIVIGTPGRLADVIKNSRSINLQNVKTLVLDEADKLLELGFMETIKDIIAQCSPERQTILFSATMNMKLNELAGMAMKNPVTISANPHFSTSQNCVQHIVRLGDKFDGPKYRNAVLLQLCGAHLKSRTLIFANTKKKCHELCILLNWFGLNCAEVHGDLTQTQRLEIVDSFQNGEVDFLIASDLFARGMDILGVKAVINYEFPVEPKRYIHRIGRTARGGLGGTAISICNEDERKEIKKIMRKNKDKLVKFPIKKSQIELIVSKIEGIHEYLVEIQKQEQLEKQYFLANVEAAKAENLIKFKDDIYNRPKREWNKKYSTPKTKRQPKKEKKEAHAPQKGFKKKLRKPHRRL